MAVLSQLVLHTTPVRRNPTAVGILWKSARTVCLRGVVVVSCRAVGLLELSVSSLLPNPIRRGNDSLQILLSARLGMSIL